MVGTVSVRVAVAEYGPPSVAHALREQVVDDLVALKPRFPDIHAINLHAPSNTVMISAYGGGVTSAMVDAMAGIENVAWVRLGSHAGAA